MHLCVMLLRNHLSFHFPMKVWTLSYLSLCSRLFTQISKLFKLWQFSVDFGFCLVKKNPPPHSQPIRSQNEAMRACSSILFCLFLLFNCVLYVCTYVVFPFTFFSLWNPYPSICLQHEKGTHFGEPSCMVYYRANPIWHTLKTAPIDYCRQHFHLQEWSVYWPLGKW